MAYKIVPTIQNTDKIVRISNGKYRMAAIFGSFSKGWASGFQISSESPCISTPFRQMDASKFQIPTLQR